MQDIPDVVPLLVCADIERTHEFLATSPQDQPYGVREFGARDLEGRRWAFVTPLT